MFASDLSFLMFVSRPSLKAVGFACLQFLFFHFLRATLDRRREKSLFDVTLVEKLHSLQKAIYTRT